MKTGHLWKKGFGVFGVVGMVVISLLIIPTESEAQSEWVQTTQADFDSATTKWNVDTTSDPGNVSLVSNSTNWTKAQANPVIDVSAPGSWREIAARSPEVVWDGSQFHMWFYVCDGPSCSGNQNGTAYAASADGYHWTVRETDAVLLPGTLGDWDESCAVASSVHYLGDQFHMWYTGCAGNDPGTVEQRVGYAYSDDGISWTKPDLGVISYGGSTSNNIVMEEAQPWESGHGIRYSTIVSDGGIYHMYYVSGSPSQIGYANSTDGFSWTKYSGNPVVQPGLSGGWDGAHVTSPHVLLEGGVFKMWYAGDVGTANHQIGYAESLDGVTWTSMSPNPVVPRGLPGEWDRQLVVSPCVLFDQQSSNYRMWFEGMETGDPPSRIGHAVSSDGLSWAKRAMNPVMDLGLPGEWDDSGIAVGSVIKEGDVYEMWYHGLSASSWRIGHAQSSDGVHWTKHPSNPVLDHGLPGTWDSAEVSDPFVIKDGGMYKMWYSGHTGSFSTFRIGYAESTDGIIWVKNGNPVLGPGPIGSWEDQGVALPSVMKEGGVYKMWYSGYDGTYFRTGYAESPDGLSWTKPGTDPVLDLDPPGSWEDDHVWDSTVVRNEDLYEMWYSGGGSGEYRIGYASSPDGTNWTKHGENPILDIGPSAWDSAAVTGPFVLKDGHALRMWFHGSDGSWRIGYAASQYNSMGMLQSSVIDSGTEVTYANISWDAVSPVGALLAVSIRTGDTPVPDATWTDWTEDIWNTSYSVINVVSRYLQYRVTFVSVDGRVTPTLSEVTVGYEENTAIAPSLLSPDDGTWTPDSTPTFSWTFNDLEGDTQTAFVVEIEDNSSFTAVDFTSGVVASSDESWTVTAELAQGSWFWRVRTQESNGSWSGNSTVWSFEVDTPPSAPAGLVVEPGERGVLELTWNANPEDDIEGYNVFRSDSSSGSHEKINDVLVLSASYGDTELPDGTTFYYTVTAVDVRNQESSLSLEASGTTVEGMDFLSEYWWILLLIILIVIVIIILVVGRKKPEEEEPEEEKPAEEEETVPEPRETEMTDEDRLQKLERRHEEGDISEETYNELKKRYSGEQD